MLIDVSTKVVNKWLPTNTIIIRQGDNSKSVYFIKSGKVNLLWKVDFKTRLEISELIDPEEHYMIDDPE